MGKERCTLRFIQIAVYSCKGNKACLFRFRGSGYIYTQRPVENMAFGFASFFPPTTNTEIRKRIKAGSWNVPAQILITAVSVPWFAILNGAPGTIWLTVANLVVTDSFCRRHFSTHRIRLAGGSNRQVAVTDELTCVHLYRLAVPQVSIISANEIEFSYWRGRAGFRSLPTTARPIHASTKMRPSNRPIGQRAMKYIFGKNVL